MSAPSALRWHRLSKGKGDVTPLLQGGDRRSKRIEGHAGAIMTDLAKVPHDQRKSVYIFGAICPQEARHLRTRAGGNVLDNLALYCTDRRDFLACFGAL